MNGNGDSNLSPEAVQIGSKLLGDSQPCYVIAEIGINHNGDIDLAKRLISVAIAAGCDAVKFQKRTVDVVYSAEELARPRESPFLGLTQRGPEKRPGTRLLRLPGNRCLLPRQQDHVVRFVLGREVG